MVSPQTRQTNGRLWDLATKVAVPLVVLLCGTACATVVVHEIRLAVIENDNGNFHSQYTRDVAEIKEILKRIEDRVHDIEVKGLRVVGASNPQ